MALLNLAIARLLPRTGHVAIRETSVAHVRPRRVTPHSASADASPDYVSYWLDLHEEGDIIAPYVLADLGVGPDTTPE